MPSKPPESLDKTLSFTLKNLSDKDTIVVGDVFLKIAPFLRAYSQYGVHYSRGVERLREMEKADRFREWVRGLGDKV